MLRCRRRAEPSFSTAPAQACAGAPAATFEAPSGSASIAAGFIEAVRMPALAHPRDAAKPPFQSVANPACVVTENPKEPESHRNPGESDG